MPRIFKIQTFISIFKKGGIDKAILISIISRVISLFTGPMTAFMTIKFLSKEEQGFFYTFASLQGLTLFFELGLTFLIMQLASYEKASLDWDSTQRKMNGDLKAKQRLSSLLRICVKYYSLSSLLLVVTLVVAGWIFFSQKQYFTAWQIPWLLTCITTGISLFFVPLNGILEGCGKIAEVYKNGMIQILVSTVFFWIALFLNCGLYSPLIQWLVSTSVAIFLLFLKYRVFFVDLWKTPFSEQNQVSWKQEIWPLQWKLAIGWISGYFLYRFTTPLIFKFCGPVVAGQFGMTQKIFDTVQSTGFTWVNSKAANFGTLRAQDKIAEAWSVFKKSLLLGSSLVSVIGIFAVIGLGLAPHFGFQNISLRFLNLGDTFLIAINATLGCIASSIIVYIRSEKRDPFAPAYAVAAIVQILLYFFVAPMFGVTGFILTSILVNAVIFLPWCVKELRKGLPNSSNVSS